MNIDAAKTFFKNHDGQMFYMAREDPESYDAFRELNIPKHLIEKWATQLFAEYKADILALENRNHDLSPLSHQLSQSSWIKFGKAIDLAQNYESLWKDLHDLIFEERNRVRPSERIIIAESILGRTDLRFKSSVPFYCLESNQKRLAEKFLKLASLLIRESTKANYDHERHERVKLRLAKIRRRMNFPLLYLVFRR